MTQQDEELLLNDICARIPYGVIGAVTHYDEIKKEPAYLLGALWGIDGYNRVQFAYLPEYGDDESAYNYFDFKLFKPYLRPMSSMTEEEAVEYCDLQDKFLLSNQYPVTDGYALFDWLNKKMFDFRGLIPKDLALSTDKYNPYSN